MFIKKSKLIHNFLSDQAKMKSLFLIILFISCLSVPTNLAASFHWSNNIDCQGVNIVVTNIDPGSLCYTVQNSIDGNSSSSSFSFTLECTDNNKFGLLTFYDDSDCLY